LLKLSGLYGKKVKERKFESKNTYHPGCMSANIHTIQENKSRKEFSRSRLTIHKPCCSDPSMHLSIDGISSPVHKTFDCHGTTEKFLLPLDYYLPVPSLTKGRGISKQMYQY
jgi:hypothetical protein